MSWGIDWVATGAMLGGVATAVYAVFTWLLWKNSKEILIQTQKLHLDDTRPWIEVRNVRLEENAPKLVGEIYNHGKSPALVRNLVLITEGVDKNGSKIDPHRGEIIRPDVLFPQSIEAFNFPIFVESLTQILFKVIVRYDSGAGEQFHAAAYYYSPEGDTVTKVACDPELVMLT